MYVYMYSIYVQYVCMYVCMYISPSPARSLKCMYVCMFVCNSLLTCMHTYIHTYICIRMLRSSMICSYCCLPMHLSSCIGIMYDVCIYQVGGYWPGLPKTTGS